MWVLTPPTLSPKTLIVLLVVVIWCCLIVGIIYTSAIQIKTGPIIHYLRYSTLVFVVLVVVAAVLVLVLPTSTRKSIFEETGMMVCLVPLILILRLILVILCCLRVDTIHT